MNSVKAYYRRRGSRIGYRLFLGGVRHFGYYPKAKKTVSHKQARYLMMEQVAKRLDLPAAAKILDAGCGEGHTSNFFAKKYGWRMTGIDLLPESIARAKAQATRQATGANFRVASYMKLPFAEASFDGVFTFETLYHAPDVDAAIKELRRVLKPGGRLVLVEYTIAPELQAMRDTNSAKFGKAVVQGSAAIGMMDSLHGSFEKRLQKLGFMNIKGENLTKFVMPMLAWFHKASALPFWLLRLSGQALQHINIPTAYYWRSLAEAGLWRYNIFSANRPKR